MKIRVDEDRFDDLQVRLLQELVESIKTALERAGIKDARTVHEATGKIAFAVSSIIDGSRMMTLDGERVLPVLTFAASTGDNSDLITCDGNSCLHAYVQTMLDDVFYGEESDDDD